MKRTTHHINTSIAAIFFVFSSTQAHATGLGLAAGIGYEDWQEDEDINYSGDRHLYNLGFIFDTAVRRDQLINYRLTLLRETNDGSRIKMRGWSATHDVAFGLVRRENYRFWVGPQVKVTFHNKLTLKTDEEIATSSDAQFYESKLGDVWGFGVGPAVGINLHLPKTMSFLFTASYLIGNYNGDTDYTTTSGKKYGDLHVGSTGLYITTGVVFRINE
jgi:hypothetical protein